MSLLKQAGKAVGNISASKSLNAFITPSIGEPLISTFGHALSSAQLPLSGVHVALKDNICTLDSTTTCASAALQDFNSPIQATVVAKLQDAGAILCGKTNMDEFGMGSNSINSINGPVVNALNSQLSAGGSSGGSAVAVKAGLCKVALGTDTGGSVRLPAAYNGVVGFKPSYGMVSRWGVVAYANSLDTVGIIGDSVKAVHQVYDVIKGHDVRDPTSLTEQTRSRIKQVIESNARNGNALRIGVPQEFLINELGASVTSALTLVLQNLQKAGHQVFAISLPMTKLALASYYVIAPSEASSNLARFDGVRYGKQATTSRESAHALYSATRGSMLGSEVRRRILLGTFSLSSTCMDNYYRQAQKIRRLVQQDFNRVFICPHPLLETGDTDATNSGEGIDLVIGPTSATLPPHIGDLQGQNATESYKADLFTVPASLAGLPAVSVPVKHGGSSMDSNSVGIQVIGQFGNDAAVLEAARLIEYM